MDRKAVSVSAGRAAFQHLARYTGASDINATSSSIPYLVSESGFHRGGDAQRRVEAAEVVVGKVERDGRRMVIQLL